MRIEFVNPGASAGAGGILAARAFEGAVPSSVLEVLDRELAGKVARLVERGRFRGRLGEALTFLMPAGIDADSVLVVGAGRQDAWNIRSAELWAAHTYAAVKASGAGTLMIDLQLRLEVAAHALDCAWLHRFDNIEPGRSRRRSPRSRRRRSLRTILRERRAPTKIWPDWPTVSALRATWCPSGNVFTRPNARRVKELSRVGLSVEVLGEPEMERLGMGALLGVGQGSARASQLAVIMWNGAKDASAPPVAFVGKGVCFDTGGISIKPADHMEEMIIDMSGAAAVTGAMYALAARKAKVNAVGILGLVENMPDGAAQRPGDIVKTMSGQTVEVINTDAEGRLVPAGMRSVR